MDKKIFKHHGVEMIEDDPDKYPMVDKTQGSSAVATVMSGYCRLHPEKEEETPFFCYTKKFKPDAHEGFSNTIQTMCIMRHVEQLKPYWPDVHDINYRETMITTASLDGQSLDHFFQSNDIFDESNHDIGKKIFGTLGMFFDVLYDNDIYHGDLQCKNLFVRNQGDKLSLKMIDFDDMRLYTKSDSDYKRFSTMNEKDISDMIQSIFGYVGGVGSIADKVTGLKKMLQLSRESCYENIQLNEWLEAKVRYNQWMQDSRRPIEVVRR